MKIRTGFVSNSSTTSFCIYGVCIGDTEEVAKKIKPESKVHGCEHEFDREKAKFCPTCGKKAWVSDDDERDFAYEVEEYFEKMGLDVRNWDGGEETEAGVYVGSFLTSEEMNKSKDPLGLLRKTEDKLKEQFPKEKIRFYSDVSYG